MIMNQNVLIRIRSSSRQIIKTALDNMVLLNFMIDKKLIEPYMVDKYIEEAEKNGKIEATALLIEYRANQTGDSEFNLGDL